ncbi:MAG: dihydrodipicolinate synthase family protein, partial [bacterium]|nr:dihydrodipicolinate synthase family protein [bacterium]
MAEQPKIRGIVAVLVTPFDEAEEVVYEDVSRQVEAAVAFGIGAVCLPAYASEFYKLSGKERLAVVRQAVEASAGRIPVVGQSNHPSAKQAGDLARANADAGADVISFALPRQFGTSELDLLAYCKTICNAVETPILIQDFNPGGATVGETFCRQLRTSCENFEYIKLEEPLLGPKLRAIREATEDRVAVLEGWGGMYMPELLGEGLSGAMPGLGHADVMNRIWQLGTSGDLEGALDVFDGVLPQVVFSLQNLEFYLTVEKRLLAERGILEHATVRTLTLTPDSETLAHADRLNERVLRLV